MKRALALVLLVLAMDATAVDFSSKSIGSGGVATWEEDATDDSGVFLVRDRAACVNTGSTDFEIWASNAGGTKLHLWNGSVMDGVSCSPEDGNTTCGSAVLEPGYYVFTPKQTGASALCVGAK